MERAGRERILSQFGEGDPIRVELALELGRIWRSLSTEPGFQHQFRESALRYFRQIPEEFREESWSYSEAGIFGTGIWLRSRRDLVTPAVFVREGLAPRSGGPLAMTPAAAISSIWPSRFPSREVFAVGLPPAQELRASPGSGISSSGGLGTLGAKATDGRGVALITTAGHVVQEVGATVHNGVGSAIFVDHLSKRPTGVDCADIAIVQLNSGAKDSGGPTISGTADARRGDHVIVHGRSGTRQGWVRGVSLSWGRDVTGGSWGNVYITDRSVSLPGDSGAPVLFRDRPTLAGHIVAGDQGSYSLIQQAAYQFSEANVRLRP